MDPRLRAGFDPKRLKIRINSILAFLEILSSKKYSNFRKYAHPLHVKEGIITKKVFPVFSEIFFLDLFGLVMYIWELMGVTEKFAFQMWKINIDLLGFMRELLRGAYLR